MVANLLTFQDGFSSFVSLREPGWHSLGTVLDQEVMTAEQALQEARLAGWDVRLVDLQAVVVGDGGVSTIPVPDNFATVRTDPVTGAPVVLGLVGKRYVPIQNEVAFSVLSDIADESGASFETAGALGNGERVFVSMRLPQHMLIGGRDAVDMYLFATTSHDGSSNLMVGATPVRVVCQNTLTAALRGAKHLHKVRHTRNATLRVEEARRTLDLSFGYFDTFAVVADQLISTSFSDAELTAFLDTLYGEPQEESERSKTIHANRSAEIKRLFRQADTQADIRGTAWGAYNAVVEYQDYVASVKGGDPETRRAERTMIRGEEVKSRAMALLTA